VNLSWIPPAQSECVVVANYLMQYREVGTSVWIPAGTVPGTQTTGSIGGLPTNKRLEFRVGRVADAGSDLFSGVSAASGSLPLTPQAVSATVGASPGEVNLIWLATEPEPCFANTDYNVQVFTTAWADFSRPPSAEKSATVTGLTPGVQYFFRVRAVNPIGVSGYSLARGFTIPNL
jgi:hypothetical protein